MRSVAEIAADGAGNARRRLDPARQLAPPVDGLAGRRWQGSRKLLIVAAELASRPFGHAAEARARIAARKAGATALMASEGLDGLPDLADRIAVMRDGRIAQGAADPGATAREIGARMIGPG